MPRPAVNGDLEVGADVRVGSARGGRLTNVGGLGSNTVVPCRAPVTTASGADVRRGTASGSGRAARGATPGRVEGGRGPGRLTAARVAVFAGADAFRLAADERPDERVRLIWKAGSNPAPPTSEDWVTTDAGSGAGLAAATPGVADPARGAGALEGSGGGVPGSGCTDWAGASAVGGACVASGVGAGATGCTGAGVVAGAPAGSGTDRAGSKVSGST